MKQDKIILNNQLISYLVNQTAGEKCLLFLHGWRSNKEIWNNVISKFNGYSIYTLDLPGFGQSQVPPLPMAIGDYAEVIKSFIEKLNLNQVIIIGHSFGGRVGIKLASLHPELISKLVLVDSAGFAMDSKKKSAMNMAAKIVKPFFKLSMMQGLRKKIYQTIGAEDYIATPELQKTFVNITSEDLTSDMQKISCPTLIINGQNDQDTPISFGEKMKALIPNSKFQIIANAGHFSFLDQPQEFITLLTDFIKE